MAKKPQADRSSGCEGAEDWGFQWEHPHGIGQYFQRNFVSIRSRIYFYHNGEIWPGKISAAVRLVMDRLAISWAVSGS
jgi:hypothetical protein